MFHQFAVHGDLTDRTRVQMLVELFADALEQDDKARNLDAAAGTARTRADEHQDDQNRTGQTRPLVEIRRGKTGGRDDRADLKSGVAETLAETGVQGADVERDHRDGDADDAEIAEHLGAGKGLPPFFLQNQEVGVEIDAEQDHKDRDDNLNIGGISCDAVALDAETAGACGGEGGVERVKQRHASEQEEDKFQHGQHDIDAVQNPRTGLDLRDEAADRGTRAFRLHEVHAAAAGHRKQDEQKDQHTHAADPVGKATPHQDAVRHDLDIRQDAGTGGGKAGYGFKQCVDRIGNRAGEQKRECTGDTQDNPAEGNRDIALFQIKDFVLGFSADQNQSRRQTDRNGDQKGKSGCLLIDQRGGEREKQECGLQHENPADNIQDN